MSQDEEISTFLCIKAKIFIPHGQNFTIKFCILYPRKKLLFIKNAKNDETCENIYNEFELISFEESVKKTYTKLSPWKFGFVIVTSTKELMMFAKNETDYHLWIRGLYIMFPNFVKARRNHPNILEINSDIVFQPIKCKGKNRPNVQKQIKRFKVCNEILFSIYDYTTNKKNKKIENNNKYSNIHFDEILLTPEKELPENTSKNINSNKGEKIYIKKTVNQKVPSYSKPQENSIDLYKFDNLFPKINLILPSSILNKPPKPKSVDTKASNHITKSPSHTTIGSTIKIKSSTMLPDPFHQSKYTLNSHYELPTYTPSELSNYSSVVDDVIEYSFLSTLH